MMLCSGICIFFAQNLMQNLCLMVDLWQNISEPFILHLKITYAMAAADAKL